MLISVDSGKKVRSMPHAAEYTAWRKRISDDDYQKIVDALNDKVSDSDIATSSWIPGSDWTGTVYEPIYHACRDDVTAAGMFFGLILFKLLMERTDYVWGFGHYQKDGIPIKGMTYFILRGN